MLDSKDFVYLILAGAAVMIGLLWRTGWALAKASFIRLIEGFETSLKTQAQALEKSNRDQSDALKKTTDETKIALNQNTEGINNLTGSLNAFVIEMKMNREKDDARYGGVSQRIDDNHEFMMAQFARADRELEKLRFKAHDHGGHIQTILYKIGMEERADKLKQAHDEEAKELAKLEQAKKTY